MNIFNLKSEVQLSPCRRNLFAFTALLVIILSIYSNTFDCSWQFDDRDNIELNKSIHMEKLDWQNIQNAFFAHSKERKLYRPVACLSLAVNYYFGQTNVFGYHLVNTSVHILASIFLFLFIYHTLNIPLLKPKYGADSYFIALLATCFWAINPVQTQAITYIVQRMASMAAMFYIMSMYFFVKGRISQNRKRKVLCFLMCLFSGLFAVGSKENAAMLPISIVIFDLFFIQGLTKENLKKNARMLLVLIIPILIFALILRGSSVFNPDQILKQYESVRPFTLMERLLTEPRIILFYISLLLYPMPQRLSICHDMAISHSLINPPSTIIAILVILAVLGLCIIKSTRWPFIAYCIIFYFLNHIIEGSIFGLELIFEHRNYLPSMLLFAPMAILIVKALNFYSKKRAMQVVIGVFVILLLVGFSHSAFVRNYTWKTGGSLWADASSKAPDLARAHLNLGFYFTRQKMFERALTEFETASSSRILCNLTDRGTSLYNVGYVYQKMGDLDQALEYYQRSEKIFPSYANNYNNMGMVYVQKGDNRKALEYFLQAIRIDGNAIKPLRNAAMCLLKEGEIDKALLGLNRAMEINGRDARVLGGKGYAHRLQGSYGDAYLCFQKAMGIEPHDPGIHLYMAEIYFKRGMNKKAEKEVVEFIKRERDGVLSDYVTGIADEDNFKHILPYKTMVMRELVRVYEKTGAALGDKTNDLKEKISEMEE